MEYVCYEQSTAKRVPIRVSHDTPPWPSSRNEFSSTRCVSSMNVISPAEKLGTRERAIAIVIGAIERCGVERELLAADAPGTQARFGST